MCDIICTTCDNIHPSPNHQTFVCVCVHACAARAPDQIQMFLSQINVIIIELYTIRWWLIGTMNLPDTEQHVYYYIIIVTMDWYPEECPLFTLHYKVQAPEREGISMAERERESTRELV